MEAVELMVSAMTTGLAVGMVGRVLGLAIESVTRGSR